MRYSHLNTTRSRLYSRFITPKSDDPEARRREYILNVLLSGLVVITGLALAVSLVEYLSRGQFYNNGSLTSTLMFMVLTLGLLTVSRRGRYKLAAYIFVILVCSAATQFVVQWSFELPEAQLSYAVVIVMAGILLSARAAMIFAAIISFLVLGFSYAQIDHLLKPDTSWLYKPFIYGDAIGYVVVFAFIGLISWLSNREIDRSLERALTSEAALAKERDTLEVKVVERTQELEQLQLARLLELQRFAEFGRLSAGLLHEVSNPLTAASLNLEALSKEQHSELVMQVQRSLHQLERYVLAARKQLQGESRITTFSVRSEVIQLTKLLSHMAKKAKVKVILQQTGSYRVRGDPVKFSQMLANLLANAVEAYESQKSPGGQQEVVIAVNQEGANLVLTVSDKGRGIAENQLSQLFDPFYTTKSGTRQRGMGIGLALVKQFVEQDFAGTVSVTSSVSEGTSFTLRLPLRELPK